MMTLNSLVKVCLPGEGEMWGAMGEKMTFKLGQEETDGRFGLAEVVAQPRNGPPPHIHRREDELFYVLDGEFSFLLGERTFAASKGFATYLPKNVMHTFQNIGESPGRLLVMPVPTGFEKFIRAWSNPLVDRNEDAPKPSQKDLEKLIAVAPEFGIELHPEVKPTEKIECPTTDRDYWVLGQLVTLKLGSKDTAGNFSLAEVTCNPEQGVPPHIHRAMDEVFYVLEGTVEFTFEEGMKRLGAGSLVFVPRGQVHGFNNAGTGRARLFDLHTPGGFENFFEEAGMPAADRSGPPSGSIPDRDELVRLFRKHGMEIV